jgi:hexosaminidase
MQLAAQPYVPQFADSIFPAYYHQRVSHFRTLPQTQGDIIFLGNSISDGAEWSELFNDLKLKNRGISGDITAGVLHRLDEVFNRKPAKVFLLIGTNDLARGIKADSVIENIFRIADLLKARSPMTKLYIQSIFPLNESFGKFSGHMSKKKRSAG